MYASNFDSIRFVKLITSRQFLSTLLSVVAEKLTDLRNSEALLINWGLGATLKKYDQKSKSRSRLQQNCKYKFLRQAKHRFLLVFVVMDFC